MSPSATALPLTWIDGPDAGSAFGGGGLIIKATNHDTGTLYNPIPIGTSIGYSGPPGPGVAGGEATLNLPANIARPALNAVGTEDSWGIIKITDIFAVGSDGLQHSLYNHIVTPFELTAVFWGVEDFYMEQVSAGSGLAGAGQIIDGTGLRVDIYSDLAKNFDQTGGPAARIGVSGYPTASDGTLELSLLSTPGFINADGTLGGSATEFESNTANVGYAALDVIGGDPETVSQFDTDGIGFKGSSGAAFVPGVADQTTTDVWFAFTATQGNSGWDIQSNDPMLANIRAPGVPDAGSTLLLLTLGTGFLLVAHRRRRQNA
jgi:hypothetical protein